MISALFLADSEHFRAAGGAYTLCGRLAVLHSDGFSVAHFFLGSALHTICLHGSSFLEAICLTQYTIVYARVKCRPRSNASNLLTIWKIFPAIR